MAIDTLYLILGDQLNEHSPVFSRLSSADMIWMAECDQEATHVRCHKSRLVFFFSAMRHYRDSLLAKGIPVEYHQLEKDPKADLGRCFGEILAASIEKLRPSRLAVVEPGDYRVREELQSVAAEYDLPLEIVKDDSFYCSIEEFTKWRAGKKQLVLEYFYREMRKRHDILMESGKPSGGQWNFDKENRAAFGKDGPPRFRTAIRFSPSELTREVIDLVEHRFATNPGSTAEFSLPVTRAEAQQLLKDFIEHRFAYFGLYQDALWQGADPFLFHSRLSAAINVKLLLPHEVIDEAIRGAESYQVPLEALEGFIRQILGWREYVRGIYWTEMPGYAEGNALAAQHPVPELFWTGKTLMPCLADAMHSVLQHAYAHHIQRLMVLGQYALLYGVDPFEFHQWHMGMYADAIDWVSLPNVVGMSQFADGGLMASKPYCASGNYINKMSNYCSQCRFDPKKATGEDACPFTTLYWDFLSRNAARLADNRRMTFQIKNLERKNRSELVAIQRQAERHRSQ